MNNVDSRPVLQRNIDLRAIPRRPDSIGQFACWYSRHQRRRVSRGVYFDDVSPSRLGSQSSNILAPKFHFAGPGKKIFCRRALAIMFIAHSRAYVYPVWQNVRAYILHVRGRKEAARSPKNRWATRTSSPLPNPPRLGCELSARWKRPRRGCDRPLRYGIGLFLACRCRKWLILKRNG